MLLIKKTMLNIIIVTQEDPFYIPHFFKEFFKNKSNELIIKTIVIQETIGEKSKIALAKRMIYLYGFWGFIKKGFKYVKCRIKDKIKLFKFIKCRTIKSIALENNVPVLIKNDVNSEKFSSYVQENAVDLIISVSASQIFKSEILRIPKYGCINLHNGPLPKYQGMMPNFWQMYHDEEYSTLSIHKMTKKLDKGEILLQKHTKIEEEYSLEDLIILTKKKSAKYLLEILEYINRNKKIPPEIILQNEKKSYFSFPTKEDVKNFKRKGKMIL